MPHATANLLALCLVAAFLMLAAFISIPLRPDLTGPLLALGVFAAAGATILLIQPRHH